MNLQTVLKYADCCNLKLKSDIIVHVISEHANRSLAPLVVETRTEKKNFYCEAVNQFSETARFYREHFTTKSKRVKD